MPTRTKTAARPPAPRLRRWRGVLAAVVGVLALAGFLGWRVFQDQAERDQGLRLAGQGNFEAAQSLLRLALERNPQDVEAVRVLALGHLAARQPVEAEKYLNRWCELRPDAAEPYRARLELYVKQQKVSQALADAAHVLRLQPGDFGTRRLRAELLLIDGRSEEAEQEARRCLRDKPNDVGVWHALATAYHRQKRTKEATDLADRLVQQAPNYLSGLRLRAALYAEAGQYEPAIRLLRRAADRPEPERVTALYELSQILARAGRDAEAKQALAEMRLQQAKDLWNEDDKRDTNAALQARVVEAMRAAGKTDAAARFLSDILGRNPDAAGTRQLLADLQQGDKETRRQGDKESK